MESVHVNDPQESPKEPTGTEIGMRVVGEPSGPRYSISHPGGTQRGRGQGQGTQHGEMKGQKSMRR